MKSGLARYAALAILSIGILLAMAGIVMTPGFIVSTFSDSHSLTDTGIQAISVLRLLAICTGLLAVVSVLNIIYPARAQRLLELISSAGKKLESRLFHVPFCLVCASIAMAFGLLITKWGPNLSPDSLNYIVTGERIFNGIGFNGFSHHPFYPVLIAGFMHLGFDSVMAARLIPIISFALLMFPLFHLGKNTGNALTGYVTCLLCLLLTPLLRLASYAWVDMPYIFFTTIALLFMVKYVRSNESKMGILCLGALFTALAIITCLYGVALLITGIAVIVIKNRSRLKQVFLHGAIYGVISFLPEALWMCRNIILIAKPTAGGRPIEIEPLNWVFQCSRWIIGTISNELFSPVTKLCSAATEVTGLFTGTSICSYIMPILSITFILFILIYVIISSTQRKALPEYLRKTYIPILYLVIHLGGIIGRGTMVFLYFSNRYLDTVYPFLLMTGVYFIFHIYNQIKRPALKPFLFSLLTILCIGFLALQSINVVFFYKDYKDGKNLNSAFWRNSQAIAWVVDNVPEDAIVYSNNVWSIMLRIDNTYKWLSFAEEKSEEEIDKFFISLTNKEDVYILGFKEQYRKGGNPQLTNEQIIESNKRCNVLTIVADFPEATIWHVNK